LTALTARTAAGAVPLAEAAARCGQGGFVWLGLFEPGEEELAQVRDTFGPHELAVEDAQSFHMQPKIETYYQDVQLVILRAARYEDAEEVEFGNLSQLSHGLTGRYRTTASMLDTRQDADLRIRIPTHWPDMLH
jgi:Mg2+ and Co2+ transporter CorA